MGAPLQGRPPAGVHLGPVLAVEGETHTLVPAQGRAAVAVLAKAPIAPARVVNLRAAGLHHGKLQSQYLGVEPPGLL